MKPSKALPNHRVCSVARSLEVLGDRWVFLILREAFFGVRYYDQFQANLGIATNMLSNRLKRLVESGILEKNKDANDSRRVTYRLTKKGRDLYPITLALMQWGDQWLSDDKGPPLVLQHKPCGRQTAPVMCCSHCGEVIRVNEMTYEEKWRKKK